MFSIFFRKRTQILYITMWIMVAIIHFFILFRLYHLNPLPAFLDSLVFNFLFALLGLGHWYMVRFSDLRKKSPYEIFIYHLTGCAVSVLIWFEIGYQLLIVIFKSDSAYISFLEGSIVMRVLNGIFYYALIVSIYYLIINLKELREKMEKEATLVSLLKEAELNMLRSQIRPHFLFNSLNSISALTMTNPEKAQEMVIKLSEFMRYSLSFQDTIMSTLESELYHIDLYLEIEKVRFGDKLSVSKAISDEVKPWKIPAMILQPVIENAVKYGVYENVENSQIGISAKLEEGYLKVVVKNNYDPEAKVRKGTGTGLKNVGSRLIALYSRNDLMTVNKSNKEFEIELIFPPDEAN